VYDDRTAVEPLYPSTVPSTGDSPAFDALLESTDRGARRDSPVDRGSVDAKNDIDNDDLRILHAPPGYVFLLLTVFSAISLSFFQSSYTQELIIISPCYIGLHNNVSTPEMKLRTHDWPPQTPDFVTHNVLATYIQNTAAANDILSCISFQTRVDKAEKKGAKWEVQSSKVVDGEIKRGIQVSLASG